MIVTGPMRARRVVVGGRSVRQHKAGLGRGADVSKQDEHREREKRCRDDPTSYQVPQSHGDGRYLQVARMSRNRGHPSKRTPP